MGYKRGVTDGWRQLASAENLPTGWLDARLQPGQRRLFSERKSEHRGGPGGIGTELFPPRLLEMYERYGISYHQRLLR